MPPIEEQAQSNLFTPLEADRTDLQSNFAEKKLELCNLIGGGGDCIAFLLDRLTVGPFPLSFSSNGVF